MESKKLSARVQGGAKLLGRLDGDHVDAVFAGGDEWQS
jgi:hypothetical protein